MSKKIKIAVTKYEQNYRRWGNVAVFDAAGQLLGYRIFELTHVPVF